MTQVFNPLLKYGFQDNGGGGGTETSELIEWVAGDDEPVVVADRKFGSFFEGQTHLVRTIVKNGETIKTIEVQNWTEGFNSLVLGAAIKDVVSDKTNSFFFVHRISVEDVEPRSILTKYSIRGIEDTSFSSPVLSSGFIEKLVVDYENNLIIAGNFTERIVKIDLNGSVLSSFSCSTLPDGFFNSLKVDSTNRIIAVIAPSSICHLVALESNGILDSSFVYNSIETKRLHAIGDDDSLFVQRYVSASDQWEIVKLNPNGSQDYSFSPPLFDYSGENFSSEILGDVLITGKTSILCYDVNTGAPISFPFSLPLGFSYITKIYIDDSLIFFSTDSGSGLYWIDGSEWIQASGIPAHSGVNVVCVVDGFVVYNTRFDVVALDYTTGIKFPDFVSKSFIGSLVDRISALEDN